MVTGINTEYLDAEFSVVDETEPTYPYQGGGMRFKSKMKTRRQSTKKCRTSSKCM